ncbi:hypothetical protein EPYR_03935 [Erwinia pyrifoliae DSM 12163]|nr:hypothetical protein EPYR_03935 [Erwinia pyrifoliae DSM 12163]
MLLGQKRNIDQPKVKKSLPFRCLAIKLKPALVRQL